MQNIFIQREKKEQTIFYFTVSDVILMSVRTNIFRNHIPQTHEFSIHLLRRNRVVTCVWQTDCAWRSFKHYGNAIFCVFPHAGDILFIPYGCLSLSRNAHMFDEYFSRDKGIRIRGCRKRPDRGAHACIHARSRVRVSLEESRVVRILMRYSLLLATPVHICAASRCDSDFRALCLPHESLNSMRQVDVA